MQSESNFLPNGVLSNKAPSGAKVLQKDRWSLAEARAAELLARIQPNQSSEAHRNGVLSYLRCLIMKCVPSSQVFSFGSVPLKTYLPDGDIDLAAFSENEQSEDNIIKDVLRALESEEKNRNTEFLVKEIQFIPAEVKIIKCLVENFVVDISFNQISGLGALCFLEEIDNLIRQNHLFKRSIILIKAWCYYESRILGSYHGLISTYALETLVIYVFHVYSKPFAGPLEVLFRFLEFFSKFDWSNYCISLSGPVPISSLPNMKAEPPRKNWQDLLLSEQFLKACESCYGVMPSSQEIKDKPFASKYFNIVDPLRTNNNLGRSISKANFSRIKSALALGARRIERLLDCPKDNLIAEFDLFFKNTWDRNGNGYWIDTHSYNLFIRNNNVTTSHKSEVEQAQASNLSHGICQNPANRSEESKQMFGTSSDVPAASQIWNSNNNGIFTGTMVSDTEHTNTMNNTLAYRGQSTIYSPNEVHDMHHFPGFYAGSEFAHLYSEASPQHYHNTGISSENQQSFGQLSCDWRGEYAVGPENPSSGYYCEYGLGVNDKNVLPFDEAMMMHQEQHGFPIFNEYLQAPVNVSSSDVVPFPPPPHVLASGYRHENSFRVFPEDVPFFESFSGHNMPYSHDTAPFPSEFPSQRSALHEEEFTEPVDYNGLVPHSGRIRQMAVNSGSSSGNSSLKTNAPSFTPKDYVVTTNQKLVAKENGSGVPPDNRIVNKDVSSRADSSSTPALLPNLRTNFFSSSFSSGLSSKTSQPDGVSGNWIGQSSIGTDLRENTSTEAIASSYVQALQLGRKVPTTVPNSSVSNGTPFHVGPPGSSQRAVDNQSLLPVADGSIGPSFQVPNMFPFYNLPTDQTGTTFAATNDVHMDAELGILYPPLESTQHVNPTNHDAATSGYFVKESYDILDGDFTSYWVNLLYGRFCKNPQSQEPLPNPPPSTALPMHLRGQFPWYRKPTRIMNIVGNARNSVPVVPSQSASPLHGATNVRNGFWIPRFSEGTGTYLPKPSNYHQQSFYRRKPYQRSLYIECHRNEKKDNHGEREENSNLNSKERLPGCGQFDDKVDKPGSNESSHQGESSHSGISKVANFGKDSESSSTHQPSP